MKRLLLIAITALISVSSKAQDKNSAALDTIPVINGIYQYQEVVTVDNSVKKDQLYKNAKVYFIDVFNNTRDVIQYDDKEEGKIIGKGFFTECDNKMVFAGVAYLKWDVHYNTEIICKDGKYRLRFYDIVITQNAHLAQYNYGTQYLTAKDVYDRLPLQKGAYKTLYPRLINRMVAQLKASTNTLKEYMIKKQPGVSAEF